jgi:type III secretion protein D
MKRVRILTGKHAGASLDLSVGSHSIGFDHECDISISDWTFTPLRLIVGADDNVIGCWFDESGGGSATPTAAPAALSEGAVAVLAAEHPAQSHRFNSFEPHAFRDIVLCIGPVDQDWPTDMQLLDKTFQPTPQRLAQWAGSRLRARATTVFAGVAVLALCSIVGTLVFTNEPQAVKPVDTLQTVTARLQSAIRVAGVNNLTIKADTAGLVVSGMVETNEQANAVRNALRSTSSPFPISQRFSIASDVAESIRSTVGLPSAQVKHLGDGVFAYAADTPNTKVAKQAVERVAADLSGVVKRIEVTLEETQKKPVEVPILSSMKDDEISIVQTRDGQKHLVVSEVDPAVTARQALSIH